MQMMKSPLVLGLCAATVALGACAREDAQNDAPAQNEQVGEAAEDRTIAQSLDQDSRFFQSARAVGLDATLAGPGPYTVLVPSNDAFAGVEDEALAAPGDAENRAQVTRILTYHILPGVILAEDISRAIDDGDGRAVLASMGGETLTATREDGNIVLADQAGGRVTVTQADQRASNGVVHHVDGVLMPQARGAGANQQ
jgi:uncharacterized surface protein with fasciclin (FAS1) repeats